jgi:purine nucleosidase
MSPSHEPGDAARVVIDCDPGRDDALAILAALGSLGIEVEFITAVAGNVPAARAAESALRVLAVAGAGHVPVYLGAERPLVRSFTPGAALHGDMAESAPELPPPASALAGPATPALRAWCRERSGRTKRLIAIGPLTNIGELLRDDPHALRGVDEVFVMGGTVGRMATRASPTAEFNFHTDPEAADLVLRSGARIRLYDYDATTACQIPLDAFPTIARRIGEPLGAIVVGWLWHLWEYANRVYGRVGVAVHDLYAVAGAAGVQPGRWEWHSLTVDTGEELPGTLTATAAPDGEGIAVARDLDVDAMIEFLASGVARLAAAANRPR